MTATKLPKELNKDILIIEDEGDVCFLLNVILKEKQINLEHVNTLSQAKVFLSEKVPSLVFLDNSLPDGRGTDFIEYIKSNYPSVKIIMITAYHSAAERERAIKHGADMFLEKPFTRNQVYNAVHELLEIDFQASIY
ncbi:MAG: response regulator [Ferruginibacter sp.]